jgi:hypothetical protein
MPPVILFKSSGDYYVTIEIDVSVNFCVSKGSIP